MKGLVAAVLLSLATIGVQASTGDELVIMGTQAYLEGDYDQAIDHLEAAYKKGRPEALVTLAYMRLHDNPSLKHDVSRSAFYMKYAMREKDFKGVVYTAYFYQKAKTAKAAYLVGLAYFMSKSRDTYKIGDKLAWQYWFDRAVSEGYEDAVLYGKIRGAAYLEG